RKGIKNGVILSAAASLHRCILRNVWSVPDPFPITDANRRFTPVEGPLELLHMSGNITHTEDGEVYLHAHVTISLGRPEGVAMGGHLVPGAIIFSTGEVVLAEVEGCEMLRLKDSHTRALEVFPLSLDGLDERARSKAIAARKARPRPPGTK
ncbi:MAG: PPC domain-containing DNA-binding protein, partial [Nitrospinota bacterium]